jgi:hypothetical protein
MRQILFIFVALFFVGCVTAKTTKDPFDGSVLVTQDPVVITSAEFGLPGTQLGFRWKSTVPELVALDIGFQGINSVQKLAFNVDGQIYEINRPLNVFTDFQTGGRYPGWSFNSFAIPLETFKKIAMGQNVRMKVTNIRNQYTVGEFGRKKSAKYMDRSENFDKFLSQVDAQLN